MKLPRYFRLLPTVVLVGVTLLVSKGTGLVHEAYAEAEQVAALTNDPKPINADFAGGEGDQVTSASEVDVLGGLTKRRKALDVRQQQLDMQANMIAAAEQRVDTKILQLKTLQGQIAALLVQRDDAQKAQVAALVKTYSTMKPKDAARIFNQLPDEVLVPVAQAMKSDVLALVLSNMASDNAKALTVKLANKLALPQTADAPALAAPAAAPAQQASAAPAAPAAAAASNTAVKPKT
jgi:flagellar motility protein MotE (MotC chaperone)